MNNRLTYALICIVLMALVTYIPRVLPVSVFNRQIKSKYIKSFLNYVPYAVLAALTFPDIFYSTTVLASALIGTGVALILSYFEKSLVIVALCSIIAVYISELILV